MTAAVLLAALLALVPRPSGGQTPEAHRERLESIAATVYEVSSVEAPIGRQEGGQERTAAILIAIAYYESRFDWAVDLGGRRGDGGRAVCMMQVHPRGGLSPEALELNRAACFRAGLQIARRSFGACGGFPFAGGLAAYTAGRCDRGVKSSAARVRLAEGLSYAISRRAGHLDAAFVRRLESRSANAD